MYVKFSTLPPELSPEEHEAALLQLAQGLIAIARVWRDGASATLTDPDGFLRNIHAGLAGLNAYVRRQDDLRAFGQRNSRDFCGRDDTLVSIIDFLKGLFLR